MKLCFINRVLTAYPLKVVIKDKLSRLRSGNVNASKELSGYISGGGDVYYSGDPTKVSIEARGGSEAFGRGNSSELTGEHNYVLTIYMLLLINRIS